jgi:hypothetical protein
MLVAQSVGYKGSNSQDSYTGFIHEGPFFASFSIEEGTSPEVGEKLLKDFQTQLKSLQVTNLSSFESQVTNSILKLNFPTHMNLAIGFLLNDILYIKTMGKGQVYFRRGREFDLLMEGDKSASGYLQEYDLAIFTTAKINELIGTGEDIKAFMDINPPKEILEKINNESYGEEAHGFVGLFVEFLSPEAAELLPPPEEGLQTEAAQPTISTEMATNMPDETSINENSKPELIINNPSSTATIPPSATTIASQIPVSETSNVEPVVGPIQQPISSTPQIDTPTTVVQPTMSVAPTPIQPQVSSIQNQTSDDLPKKKFSIPFLSGLQFRQSKKISLIIVVILFGILLWSVVFGYQRRIAAELQKKVETTQTQIESNLAKAEEDAYLNFDGSLALIQESKDLLASLKKEVGDSHKDSIAKMSSEIEEAEAKIVKKDDKEAVEFYDLGLESEKAQGEDIYLEGNKAAILDKENKTIYILSLETKSIDKYTASEVGGATQVATNEDSLYFLNPASGIFEFTTNTKAKKVIEEDGWDNITDMQMYSGNIYLIDGGKGDIYKYLVADSGFSDKKLYFGSESTAVSNAVSMAIDSAIYVAKPNEILKFVSGAPETFATDYPETEPEFAGVYTNADIEQVYAWDKKGTTLYILGKEGEYDRQITTSALHNAQGVFVLDDKVYIFDGKKLYTVSLD